jgi:hypothetical protein
VMYTSYIDWAQEIVLKKQPTNVQCRYVWLLQFHQEIIPLQCRSRIFRNVVVSVQLAYPMETYRQHRRIQAGHMHINIQTARLVVRQCLTGAKITRTNFPGICFPAESGSNIEQSLRKTHEHRKHFLAI